MTDSHNIIGQNKRGVKPFLELVADDLLSTYGSNLSHLTMVFPGRRASLFMSEHLARLSDTPVWAPRYVSIADLFARLSPYTRADQIETICLLYRIYLRHVGDATETLDEFWTWGEVMLSDFDDVDKHLADAKQLFRNIHDLHELDEDTLTPEESEVIRRFFSHFTDEGNSALKERFLRLWNVMYDIYCDLNAELRSRGLLYGGALERDVIERLQTPGNTLIEDLVHEHHPLSARGTKGANVLSPSPQGADSDASRERYVIVGFNVLNPVEQELFAALQSADRARFYWDYDVLWTNNRQYEAGTFMRDNLARFHTPLGPEHFDNLSHLADIEFISSSTDNAQARYIPRWLSNHLDTKREADTAVVLCDEHLLQPVLHSIPDTPDSPGTPANVNVTMGFPMTDTPVFSFVMALLTMQIDGWDSRLGRFRPRFAATVMNHPYACYVDKATLELHVEGNRALLGYLTQVLAQLCHHYSLIMHPSVYDQLYSEALFRCNLQITRFIQMTDEGMLDVSVTTMRRLLHQVISSLSIPFHGEPAIGLQIMGVLETRNLDFRHLLMLSVGEGNLPKKDDTTSLIPYNLREAFGLTTIRHRVSVFAYYFYRLIQRAEHVTMVFNDTTSGGVQHEMSRFMRQLMAETDLPIRHRRLEASQGVADVAPISVAKSADILAKLRSSYLHEEGGKHRLSPTAITTYINCPLSFYYRYVVGMREQMVSEDEIDPSLIGNIFHDTAEFVYSHIYFQKFPEARADDSRSNIVRDEDRFVLSANDIDPLCRPTSSLLAHSLDFIFHINYFKPFADTQTKERAALVRRFASLDTTELADAVTQLYGGKRDLMFTGIALIIHEVIMQYLNYLFRYDRKRAPFRIVCLEDDYYLDLDVCVPPVQVEDGSDATQPATTMTITTGGRVDRLDYVEDKGLMVIDYKTGREEGLSLPDMSKVFEPKQLANKFVQTMLYSLAVAHRYGGQPTSPNLFFVRAMGRDDYEPTLSLGSRKDKQVIDDIHRFEDDFRSRLQTVINEIFDPAKPFDQCADDDNCHFCPFRQLCGRG